MKKGYSYNENDDLDELVCRLIDDFELSYNNLDRGFHNYKVMVMYYDLLSRLSSHIGYFREDIEEKIEKSLLVCDKKMENIIIKEKN